MNEEVLDERQHVFVVGSPRSGTSLVASILLSSPLYADYRAETKLLAGCETIYGNLNQGAVRKRFWEDWFRSRQFIRSGLTREEVLPVIHEQRSYIGILAAVMGLLATGQQRERWIDSTPENSAHLDEIAQSFPNARIVHVIRDGRAVSLSLAKLGWAGVKTGNFDRALYYSSLKWQESVNDVLMSKALLGRRYTELRYEDLVRSPGAVIGGLCDFLGIPMVNNSLLNSDFNKRNENAKSTLHTPNSPFGDMSSGISSKAMYRWKDVLCANQICKVEAHIGTTLDKLGYPRLCDAGLTPLYRMVIASRKTLLVLKSALKRHTSLGKYSVSPFEFESD